MRFLVKPNQYSKTMQYMEAPNEWWDNLLSNPPVIVDKDKCPLAIFGTPVSNPEHDMDSGKMRCIGANVESIYALALDYDNGISIEQFQDEYNDRQYSLYTSYSYGVKQGDRFRVIVPLATPLKCELLTCKRVKQNLLFQWHGVDECCFDRGHWQILPARNPAGQYKYYKNKGERWGITTLIYEAWKREEDAEREKRMREIASHKDDKTQERIKNWLVSQLAELECGAGTRYARVKSLLAWSMNNGLGDAVLSIPCPWEDAKWEKRWPNLIGWAVTLG